MDRRSIIAASALLLLGCTKHVTGGVDAGPAWVPLDGGPTTPLDAGSSDGGPADGGTSDAGPPPVCRTLTPPLGSVTGGTNVVLIGAGFVNGFSDPTNTETTVFFGPQQVPINGGVTVIDDNHIEVVSPSGLPGPVAVTVQNPRGMATCAQTFTYVAQIIITKLSVTSGSTLGGDPLTVFGQGFAPGMLVLIGGAEATDVQFSPDGTQIDLHTPPGQPGSADVAVIAADTEGFLRRGFVYVSPILVSSVTPSSSPLAGGGTITITGSGFTSDAQVGLGQSLAVTTYVSDTELTAVVPAAMMAGAVKLAVQTQRASGGLLSGFVYYDDTLMMPQLYAVVPNQGSISGGETVQLIGTGLLPSQGLQVAFGLTSAMVTASDGHVASVVVPMAAMPGLVDVSVSTTMGSAPNTVPFGYVVPLSLSSIAPSSGPDNPNGPLTATLTGTGFDMSCEVFIGGEEAAVTAVAADGTTITVTVPAGSAGVQDVRVVCGPPNSPLFQQATLSGGFTFTSHLQLLSLQPSVGAIAGNTSVTLYGSGFATGMMVKFGSGAATMVDVQSPQIATVRTPRGNVGYVDVTVQTSTDQNTLTDGYGYYDPTNQLGGGSNGPMLGTLNVTVWDNTEGQQGPMSNVLVVVGDGTLHGLTDTRGQITFSDPSLLKPVDITASDPPLAAASIAHLNARDVTLFLSTPVPVCPPTVMCPTPPPATLTGRVCGFKVAPGTILLPGQRLEAHVSISLPSVFDSPPFQLPIPPVEVTYDCGPFSFTTMQFGALALWAQYGIQDNGANPPTFTPLLMGYVRGLEAIPGGTSTADIILSTHMDETWPVTLDESALNAGPGGLVENELLTWLDLGGEGVIPLADVKTGATTLLLENQPRLDGQGVLFLNEAGVFDPNIGQANYPFSLTFRRLYGNLEAGVTIGPMMAFTQWVSPGTTGFWNGTLSWQSEGGSPADFQQLVVSQISANGFTPIWTVVLPGTDQSWTAPMQATGNIPAMSPLAWQLITSQTGRFNYDTFNFDELGAQDWISFTENLGTFASH